ncbi:MAG: hypothetical protein WBF29_09225, partial [Syntrophobacteria bacterium]
MAVLPGVLGCSFDRLPETTLPETSSGQAGQAGQAPPATYRSGTETNPAVPRDGCQVAHPSSSRSLRSAQSR